MPDFLLHIGEKGLLSKIFYSIDAPTMACSSAKQRDLQTLAENLAVFKQLALWPRGITLFKRAPTGADIKIQRSDKFSVSLTIKSWNQKKHQNKERNSGRHEDDSHGNIGTFSLLFLAMQLF